MRGAMIAGVMLLALGAGPVRAALDADTRETAPPIALPRDGDEYSRLVARAAAHDTGVDFRAMRFAYLKSKSRKDDTAPNQALKDALKAGDARRIRDAAVKLLSVDYIDLFGQKFLRQTCAALHDDACAQQAHFVEFGLLNSIVASGDGKTCDTGWEVVEITEEYFLVAMMDAQPERQSLVKGDHGMCDLIAVTNRDGKTQDVYFKADAVLADEAGKLR